MLSDNDIEIKVENYLKNKDWNKNINKTIEQIILSLFDLKMINFESFINNFNNEFSNITTTYLNFFIIFLKNNIQKITFDDSIKHLNLNEILNQNSSTKINKSIHKLGQSLQIINNDFYQEILNLEPSQQLFKDLSFEIIKVLNQSLSQNGFSIIQTFTNNLISENMIETIIPVIKNIILKYLTDHYDNKFWSNLFNEIWIKIKYKNLKQIINFNQKKSIDLIESFILILESLIHDQKFKKWIVDFSNDRISFEFNQSKDLKLIEYIKLKIPTFNKSEFIQDIINIINHIINDSKLGIKSIIKQYLISEIKTILK